MEFLGLPLFWIAIAVIAIVLESCTTQLISIWFALSAVVTAVVAVFTDNLIIQLAVFVVVAVLSLVLTRPLAKHLKSKSGEVPTNCDRYIGKVGEVIIDVNNNDATGQVKVEGSVWSAKSATNDILPAGTLVSINAIEGVKVIVTPVNVKTRV
ncbi:MAG: NfeD family protein [Acutalibacteraceae bacterium]